MRFPTRNKIAKNCDLDKNIKYRQIISFKPTCYWYSLGREWFDFWFLDSELEKVNNQVLCKIKIKRDTFATLSSKDKGKLLVIDSLEEVKKINKKYGVLQRFRDDGKPVRLINFQKLSEKYGGIEFRNYKQIRKQIKENKKLNWRRDYLWYFSLDVSSGCVWDLSLIEVEKKGKLKNFV